MKTVMNSYPFGLSKFPVRTIIIVVLIAITFPVSCSLLGIEHFFERGKVADNGQYVPKRPNYKLKDKQNFSIPDDLDTCGIYKLQNPIPHKNAKNVKNKHFIKFFLAGRLKKNSGQPFLEIKICRGLNLRGLTEIFNKGIDSVPGRFFV